jgi:hypothetical protein
VPAKPVTKPAPQPKAPPVVKTKPTPPVPVKVKPSIAVVYAFGQKNVIGVGQYFKIRDLWFQLTAVSPKTMKIAMVDGGFTGGKRAITVRLDHPVKLVNAATGVEYPLLFKQATSGIATTAQAAPTSAPAAAATGPATATPQQAAAPTTTTTTTTSES